MSSSMAARYEVEVRITSASDLKNVNWRHGNLKPYAVVSMDRLNRTATYADVSGGAASFRWDQALLIPFSTPIEESTLFIDINQAEATDDIKPLIGSAQVALRNQDVGIVVRRTLQLQRPSGRPQGKVEVAFTVRNLGSGQQAATRSRTESGVSPYAWEMSTLGMTEDAVIRMHEVFSGSLFRDDLDMELEV